jgi:hypothetical protein
MARFQNLAISIFCLAGHDSIARRPRRTARHPERAQRLIMDTS